MHRRERESCLLLASFRALALDLILSACRFLFSSLSPEASYTLSSSHKHCQFGHLCTCAQSTQSDTLARTKKVSSVIIIIIRFFFFCPLQITYLPPQLSLPALRLQLCTASLRKITSYPMQLAPGLDMFKDPGTSH